MSRSQCLKLRKLATCFAAFELRAATISDAAEEQALCNTCVIWQSRYIRHDFTGILLNLNLPLRGPRSPCIVLFLMCCCALSADSVATVVMSGGGELAGRIVEMAANVEAHCNYSTSSFRE
eukprot:5392314-Amphidinium_carterae.1